VKVEYTKITRFEEARVEMERQEALKLSMLCTISTHAQGHELHAVALRSTVPGGTMEAVNSWGAKESLVDVTKDIFRYAIRFDPVITKGRGGEKDFIPPVRPVFLKRAQEHAEKQTAAEVAQQQRQQTEEAAQHAAAKAQRLQEQLELLQERQQTEEARRQAAANAQLLQEQNEPLKALEKSQQAKRKREEHEARRTMKKKENTGKAKSKNSFDVVEKGRYGVTRCANCTWEIWGCQC
jgi:rubrerythrin